MTKRIIIKFESENESFSFSQPKKTYSHRATLKILEDYEKLLLS